MIWHFHTCWFYRHTFLTSSYAFQPYLICSTLNSFVFSYISLIFLGFWNMFAHIFLFFSYFLHSVICSYNLPCSFLHVLVTISLYVSNSLLPCSSYVLTFFIHISPHTCSCIFHTLSYMTLHFLTFPHRSS